MDNEKWNLLFRWKWWAVEKLVRTDSEKEFTSGGIEKVEDIQNLGCTIEWYYLERGR